MRQPLNSRPYCSGALGFLFDRQKESLARPLRARGRPARIQRVWAAEVSGYFATGPRTGACGNSTSPFVSVHVRSRPFTSALRTAVGGRHTRQRHFIFHLSSFIIRCARQRHFIFHLSSFIIRCARQRHFIFHLSSFIIFFALSIEKRFDL